MAEIAQQSGLLSLPPELRNQIYFHVFGFVQKKEHVSATARAPGTAPLLQVCRLIRSEASAMYYSYQIFSLNSCTSGFAARILIKWLGAFSIEDRSHLTTIVIDCQRPFGVGYSVADIASILRPLEELGLTVRGCVLFFSYKNHDCIAGACDTAHWHCRTGRRLVGYADFDFDLENYEESDYGSLHLQTRKQLHEEKIEKRKNDFLKMERKRIWGEPKI